MESSEEGEIKKQKPASSNFDHKIIKQVGEGTFGQVFQSIKNNITYALKKIPTNASNGISITTLREISLLRHLSHPNIIEIKEICYQSYNKFDRNNVNLYIVFPFYKYDLYNYMTIKRLTHHDRKKIAKQICEGVKYMHEKNVIHRDIKSANILLSENLDVKICDFGLAKNMQNSEMTPGVVTLWYRAPEVLLGDENYGMKIDIWSIGCILGEMCVGAPILKGKTEFEQIDKIVYLCGNINEKTFKRIKETKHYSKIRFPQGINRIASVFQIYGNDMIDLLKNTLLIDPDKRFNINNVLKHKYFEEKDGYKRR